MPASSTTSTQPGGRPPSARASSSSRWSVVDGMPVSSWSFSAATPDGAAPSTGMPACAKTCGDGVGGGRLAGAGEADDADDPARARRDLAHHRLLLVGEGDPVGALDLVEPLLADRRRSGVAAALDERERRPLDVDELGGRVAGRAARARSLADRARRRRCRVRRAASRRTRVGGRARRGAPAPRPSRPRDRRTPSASRSDPCGPSIRWAICEQLVARGLAGARTRPSSACSSRWPRPCSAARARQSSRSPTRSTCSLRSRVSTRRELGGVEAAVASRASCSTTCAPPRRELADHLARDVPELGHALARLLPLDAERAGELGAQMRLVEVAGGEPVALEDRLAVERAPLAVARGSAPCWRRSRACAGAGPGRGSCGAGRRRRRSRRACSRCTPLRAAPGHARLVLEVGERRLPRGQVRLVDRAAGLLVAERVQQADALRRREDEVEAGDRRELLRLDDCARR